MLHHPRIEKCAETDIANEIRRVIPEGITGGDSQGGSEDHESHNEDMVNKRHAALIFVPQKVWTLLLQTELFSLVKFYAEHKTNNEQYPNRTANQWTSAASA